VLPELQIDSGIRNEIVAAVETGSTVAIPASRVAVGAWSGFGYVILDSSQTSAAYRITGGISGGIISANVDDRQIVAAGATGTEVISECDTGKAVGLFVLAALVLMFAGLTLYLSHGHAMEIVIYLAMLAVSLAMLGVDAMRCNRENGW
jgi:hypothetical protein